MRKPARTRHGRTVAMVLCFGTVGCGGLQPISYRELSSAAYLRPNPADETGRVPFRYAPGADLAAYRSVVVDPVAIYRGADNQFGTLSEDDKATLAAYMQAEFTEQLRRRVAVVASPGAAPTLRLRLVLTGASTNTPVVSPFTHLDMGGNAINLVQAARGREGLVAGSVVYAVELSDAATGKLLSAYVTKQYPGAMNIVASMGSLSAAKTGIDKGAETLADELAQGRSGARGG